MTRRAGSPDFSKLIEQKTFGYHPPCPCRAGYAFLLLHPGMTALGRHGYNVGLPRLFTELLWQPA